MLQHGFVRVAAAYLDFASRIATSGVERILHLFDEAERQSVHILVFPNWRHGLHVRRFVSSARIANARSRARSRVAKRANPILRVFVIGLPWRDGDQLYNVAAVCERGRLLGVVPKSYLPNYKEFYEARWFTPGASVRTGSVGWRGQESVPFGTDLLFEDKANSAITIGVEICEDLWTPIPPSCFQALAGAKILVNLSASNEVIGKVAYRRQLVASQSGRCIAGYVYASNGVSESTTDLVFGGHGIIAENGNVLAESPRFQRDDSLVVTDIDIARLQHDRQKINSFNDSLRLLEGRSHRRISFSLQKSSSHLVRAVDAHPFVPAGQEQLAERCGEIFHAQVAGLAKRLEHIGKPQVAIGVSGGLDSTLALIVACKTFDAIAAPRAKIQAYTMPGFGTTQRTRTNALALMQHLGVSAREIDIRALCLEEMRALNHRPFGIALDGLTVETLAAKLRDVAPERRNDLVFENVQARMRTSLLMNAGFVIGTGDLSELALGWCTYNGDHISMYNPNISIPKTLVKFLVRWAAQNEFDGAARQTLLDIAATEISPELLPTGKDGAVSQSTEETIGPYELHDFFLFHFLRYGAPPEKILFLAEHATFEKSYSPDEIRRWLGVFIERFFANQFKRSCLPDGPKVGTISLSPRGDWRMPSDAEAAVWREWISAGK